MVQDLAGNWNRHGVAGIMRRFDYLQDGLFILALSTYAVNRLLILPHLGGFFRSHLSWSWSFVHSHLDDLLMMPAALPVVLWIQRQLRWRAHDGPPGWDEMAGHLILWSVICKFVGPRYLHIGVADPWDVLCFAVGGVGACAWWNIKGGRRPGVRA